MAVVLAINAGSSSVRLSLVASDGEAARTLATRHEEARLNDRYSLLTRFLETHASEQPVAVAHRIVHGGTRFAKAVLLDGAVAQVLAELVPLAPLHTPEALAWTQAVREVFGSSMPQICVFDTAFFAHLPKVASTYAIPTNLAERHGVRRFGFHGLAHRAMWRRWTQLRPDLPAGGRLISLQLGSGCSAAAIREGMPFDTSMGFSPIEGLVMSTRSGDIDPGLILHLQRVEELDIEGTERLLDRQSGLQGLSGSTGDMRVLLERLEDPAARLAIEVFCYRVRKYVGSYLAVLGGADGIVFGGGIGENSPSLRSACLSNLDALGIVLDETANRGAAGREAHISSKQSRCDVRVLLVDEAGEMAREAAAFVDVRTRGL
ncbi:MAG TPA: acetate/propionate family kinase [Thermoanaerobaculia bacterium]